MKTDRYSLPRPKSDVKLRVDADQRRFRPVIHWLLRKAWLRETLALIFAVSLGNASAQQQLSMPIATPTELSRPQLAQTLSKNDDLAAKTASSKIGKSIAVKTANLRRVQSQPQAKQQLLQLITRLANGPAFGAKVRQRVWTAGREVVGIGSYEQAGGGTGRFNLVMTMYDGDGTHSLQQISDGRLAWTRSVISKHVSLRRVDVGRLNEWVRHGERSKQSPYYVAPRLKVGAWTEILDSIDRDYILQLASGHTRPSGDQQHLTPLLVIVGTLSEEARERIKQANRTHELPELFPTVVKIAVATQPNPETQFGEGLPVRMEFWSDPIQASGSEASLSEGRLVSLIEIYSILPIAAPPIERFRFENQDLSINFVNETDRYLRRYDIRMTDTQRQQLRR